MRGLTAPRRRKAASAILSAPCAEVVPAISASVHEAESGSQQALPETVSVAPERGFLGSTAYNAPFADNEGDIALEYDSESNPSDFGEKLHQQITAKQRGIHHLDHRVKEAMRVLKFLQKFPCLDRMMAARANKDLDCGIISFWLDSMTATIRDDVWEGGRIATEKSMTGLVQQLFKNTSRPIVIGPDMKPADYSAQFCQHNIRWEALGVFLLSCGLCVGGMYPDFASLNFVGNTETGRQSLHYNLYDMANICLTFCDELECINDLYFMATLENAVLSSQVLGDAHHLVWRKVGDMSTIVFAGGYHQEDKSMDIPFWLREVRRRTLGSAYALDKSLCMFLGRPPRIARRYCKIEIPLDLQDNELTLEREALQQVLANLAPDGWSKRSRESVGSENWTRPFIINALLREELLEMCLGPPQDDLRDKALDLIHRINQTHHNMPQSLSIPPCQWSSMEVQPSWCAINFFLEYKYNEFLIRRTLVRHLKDQPFELLALAHTILTAVVEVRNIRSIPSSRLASMQWVAVLYGLPPASVLALELMQQNSKELCHIRIAQDLCNFISYLRWVHVPGDGNFRIVERARRTLQRILDKFMEKLKHRSEAQPAVTDGQQLLTPSSGIISWPDGTDLNDFSWLTAEQWDAGLWPNMNMMELPFDVI